MKVAILLCLLVAVATAMPQNKPSAKKAVDKKLVCYYGSWAVYRPGLGKFDVEDFDPFLCTHAIFGFAALSNVTWEIEAFDPWNDLEDGGGKGAYKRFNNLRNINPQLTVLLAVGGWNEGSEKYSTMVGDPAKRSTFVNSIVPFLQRFGFQGLDMDWEYPTFRGGSDVDKQNFAHLLRELKAVLQPAGLMLSSAVSAGKFTVEGAYDMQAIIESLDMINLMSYDYHGGWHTYVHHNAPVYRHPTLDVEGENLYFNLNFSVNFWVGLLGEHSDRLTVGLPLYSRGWTLDDPAQSGLYDTGTNGTRGPYTRQDSILGYNELCEIMEDPAVTDFEVHWQNEIQAKYVTFRGDQWYSFEDTEALAIKVNLINSLPVGGAMVWSVETDDFQNVCRNGKNPLLNFIVTTLNGHIPTPDPDRTTATAGTTTTNSFTNPPDAHCSYPGLNPIGPCSAEYYTCEYGPDGWIEHFGSCPPPLIMNPDILNCDYEEHVPGCNIEQIIFSSSRRDIKH